jgi:molecular chaperone Hsp33
LTGPGTSDERDTLQRFVFERARVRGELVRLDATWREMNRRGDYPAALEGPLGELTAACALMAATLDLDGGGLVLQIQSAGPVSLLVVDCRSDLSLRAMAKWEGDLSELGPEPSLRGLTSGGRCVLTLEPGGQGQVYQSVVPLDGDSVVEVLERYMQRSEQIETRFHLAAEASHARGVLLQRLPPRGESAGPEPDADPDLWNRSSMLLSTLTRDELLDLPGEKILRRLYHHEDLRVFESLPVRFACRCSRERVGSVLRMLGSGETRSLLEERAEIEVTCDYCRERYVFDAHQAEQELVDDPSSGRLLEER